MILVSTQTRSHTSRSHTPRTMLAAGAVGLSLITLATGAGQPAMASLQQQGSDVGATTATPRHQSWIAPGQAQSFFSRMLAAIAAPVSDANLQVMESWARAEGSYLAYNPWNTTQRAPGSTVDANGSTSFADAASAISATARQLLSLYPAVVGGFRASNPSQTIAAIVASPWASSQYYGKTNYQLSTIWRVYLGITRGDWTPLPVRIVPDRRVPGVVPGIRNRSGGGVVTVYWSKAPDNGSAITRYQVGIRRQTASGNGWRPRVVKMSSTNARSVAWVGLMSGKRHQTIVRARNANGFGPWSAPLRARP